VMNAGICNMRAKIKIHSERIRRRGVSHCQITQYGPSGTRGDPLDSQFRAMMNSVVDR